MGVDGLYKFINKNFPDIFNSISITEIKGKSCIIDGMQHIYGQLIYMRSRDKEVITLDGKNISHIHGLINSLTYYLKNGIIPIFIFDGKTPDIKRKKIEERKKNLKDNLLKLKDLEDKKKNLNNYINTLTTETIVSNLIDRDDELIFGTPPVEMININDEMLKMNNIQEEYKRIYKKSIIMKDYFIKDWIQILELLGLPVIKASGEADPVCAFMLKNNPHIYGIISDDSDMLVFGAPILMRKSINQQFTIIELKKILDKIEFLLSTEYNQYIKFNIENLIDYSILLGTDYGTFNLNEQCNDSLELLKYYVSNDKDFKKIISQDQYENFEIIKNYYMEQNFHEQYKDFLQLPKWKKPNLMELKKRLLELDVDEDYIDKNNEFLDLCYNRIQKGKHVFKNNYDNLVNKNNTYARFRSNSFDSKKSYSFDSKKSYSFNKFYKNDNDNDNDNNNNNNFKKITKNPTFYSEKFAYYENKDKNKNKYKNKYYNVTENIYSDSSSNYSIENNDNINNDNINNDNTNNDNTNNEIELYTNLKNNDNDIFYFETSDF